MSAPFIAETFEFPQPDGTTITVRGTGDQHRARFETMDGIPLVRGEDGYFREVPAPAGGRGEAAGRAEPIEIASPLKKRESRWEKRRRETHRPARRGLAPGPQGAPPLRQTIGTFVGLTLLIDFSDSPATIGRAEVERFCNRAGYTGFGNNGSVTDYFREVSGGKLTYTNIVAPYYRAKKTKTYYTDPAQPFGKRAQELIREALKHHIAAGFNFAPLTSDGQNFIYALNIFYAGPRVNQWSQGLWPHQWTLSPKVTLANGKIFADYQMTDMGNQLTLGTFCHENGHMICDFPDLYQYSGTGRGAGYYCLMCYGSNAGSGKNPVHVGAYLKNEAGWGTATNAAPGTVSLAAGSNQFLIHSKSASEYFIIENRQRIGRDVGLPSDGLAIWHIDENASNTNPNPSGQFAYECALVQADNLSHLENGSNYGDPKDLFFNGNNDGFSDTTLPKSRWRNNTPSGLKISQIGPSGPTMHFQVT